MSKARDCWIVCSETDLIQLAGRDEKLGRIIETLGPLKRRARPDPFQGLLHAVIGQQISGKAQESIWRRVESAIVPLTPARVVSLHEDDLRACGVSGRKTSCIQEIARAFANGKMANLESMDDEALIQRLCVFKGVGRWTAEMLLIFTFGRKNVLSFGDLGIQRGLRMLHDHKHITTELFAHYRECYAPLGSIASLYLWELASGRLKNYMDPAAE